MNILRAPPLRVFRNRISNNSLARAGCPDVMCIIHHITSLNRSITYWYYRTAYSRNGCRNPRFVVIYARQCSSCSTIRCITYLLPFRAYLFRWSAKNQYLSRCSLLSSSTLSYGIAGNCPISPLPNNANFFNMLRASSTIPWNMLANWAMSAFIF